MEIKQPAYYMHFNKFHPMKGDIIQINDIKIVIVKVYTSTIIKKLLSYLGFTFKTNYIKVKQLQYGNKTKRLFFP